MFINKREGFNEGIVWWDDDLKNTQGVDLLFFIQDQSGKAEHKFRYLTLEHDLTQEESIITQNYSSSVKRNIKKAIKAGIIGEEWLLDNDQEIKNYVDMFNNFAQSKNIFGTSLDLIKSMVQANKLRVTVAKHNNSILQVHSHYVDKIRARLYHSFTINHDNPLIVSLANKFLTNYDMLFFKQEDYKIYDMGGTYREDQKDLETAKNIAYFKLRFGGKQTLWWKGATALNQKGQAMLKKYFKNF